MHKSALRTNYILFSLIFAFYKFIDNSSTVIINYYLFETILFIYFMLYTFVDVGITFTGLSGILSLPLNWCYNYDDNFAAGESMSIKR